MTQASSPINNKALLDRLLSLHPKKIASIHSSEFLYQYNKYLSVNLIFIYKNIGETDINNLPNFKKIILDNKNTLNITIVNCNFIKNVIYKDSNEKAQQNTIVHSKQAQLSAALDFLNLFHSFRIRFHFDNF